MGSEMFVLIDTSYYTVFRRELAPCITAGIVTINLLISSSAKESNTFFSTALRHSRFSLSLSLLAYECSWGERARASSSRLGGVST